MTRSVFRWLESVFHWSKSVFRWPTFLMTNKHKKVWKMVSRKSLSGKQTQPKRKTLSCKLNQIFLWLESVFRWLESVFHWPESIFRWPTFLMANKHRKVWKMVSRKVNSGEQKWPLIETKCSPVINILFSYLYSLKSNSIPFFIMKSDFIIIIIIVDVQTSLRASQLIPRALKLTTM